MDLHITYIGLGSNLAQPTQQVLAARQALCKLPGTECLSFSSLYQTKAVGPVQPDYINACAQLRTALSSIELLDALQAIEQQHKRVRTVRWGPRTLDLDLLLYDQQQINHPRLVVPHPRLSERSFVIVPLYEIAPDLSLPNGTSIASLWATCDRSDLVKLPNDL